jgi:hypothetical protein
VVAGIYGVATCNNIDRVYKIHGIDFFRHTAIVDFGVDVTLNFDNLDRAALNAKYNEFKIPLWVEHT